MRIVVASDHRGFEKKRWLLPMLRDAGHDVADVGCDSSVSCDYPDFAEPAAAAVSEKRADVAVLLDNSGIGMSIVANKFPGVRAALVQDEVAAKLAREANHCNALCLACEILSDTQIQKIVAVFLDTGFVGGRHDRRIRKIEAIESKVMGK
jgi:ribose 5-phosphate isomerase B